MAVATAGSGGVVRVRLLPDKRCSQLIDTTVELLELIPPRDVVIDDIAASAGVSRALVYRYFSGLDDLLGQARRRFFSTLHNELERALAFEREPPDHLRAVVATTVRFAAAHPGAFCNLVDGLPSSTGDSPVTAAILRLTPALQPDRDAALVARAAAALIESGIVSWLRDERTDADTVIDLLSTLAAYGLQGDAAPSAQRRRPNPHNTAPADAPIPLFGSRQTRVPGRPGTVSLGRVGGTTKTMKENQ